MKEPPFTSNYFLRQNQSLQKLQDELGKSLSASILITSPDGDQLTRPFINNPVASNNNNSGNLWSCCEESLKRLQNQASTQRETSTGTCECGISLAVHPVFTGDKHTANWNLLQFVNNNGVQESFINKAIQYNYSPSQAAKAFSNLVLVTSDRFNNALNIIVGLADTCNQVLEQSNLSNESLYKTSTIVDQPSKLESVAFQISQLSQGNLTLNQLLDAIKKIIIDVFSTEHVTFVLLNNESESSSIIDTSLEIAEESTFIPENGILNYVIKKASPLLVSRSAIELMIHEEIIDYFVPVPHSMLGVPLIINNSVIGMIALESTRRELIFNNDDENKLVYISKQVAFSVQRILNEQALTKAKNEAEESSRLKSSLLANMSHELRTPMTGILGFSEILHDELEEDRLKNMASTIFKSATRLMTTLNSIMDLSAIESNKTSLALKPVNVKTLIMPFVQNAYAIASDKGLYIRTSLSPSVNALADEKLLGQLIHHLFDNAIKFTIDGGISISAYANPKKPSEVIIKISDTGIGIAPEHHKLIFEEFRQVSEGLSRTFEGSGLGLSLVSKIAKLLNAQIKVESVPDKGSDFYVTLPSSVPAQTETFIDAEQNEIINTSRLSRGSVPEVLIVEDNEINRMLAALYLREICNIDMAENGYAAMIKIKSKKYDAVLMDINLGAGPNGIHVAQQIRLLDSYRDVPIIAVTGYTMQGDREKLLANGCSHYVPKPYDKKTLIKLFAGLLYRKEVKL